MDLNKMNDILERARSALTILPMTDDDNRRRTAEAIAGLDYLVANLYPCRDCSGRGYKIQTTQPPNPAVRIRMVNGRQVYVYKCGLCQGKGQEYDRQCTGCAKVFQVEAFPNYVIDNHIEGQKCPACRKSWLDVAGPDAEGMGTIARLTPASRRFQFVSEVMPEALVPPPGSVQDEEHQSDPIKKKDLDEEIVKTVADAKKERKKRKGNR